MIVDHVAGVIFSVRIEPDTIRFATRLSMPLFAVLLGFFLASSTKTHWKRVLQLAAAAVAINLFFYFVYHGLNYHKYDKLEILASLLVCYVAHLILGRQLVWCFAAAYFFLHDPTRELFDYSVSVVVTCVAHGVILKIYGWRVASIAGLLVLPATIFVTTPTQYAIYFILPAVWLVAWGSLFPKLLVPVVETLGRYPLTTYLTQYFIILGSKVLFLR